MAKLPTIEEMTKDVAQRAMQEITINDMPLSEFVEKVNNAIENNDCNLTTCRYNKDGKCTNEEKRKECVEVSKAVLCMDEKSISDFYAKMEFETITQWEKSLTDICDTNPNCENDPRNCGFAVEYSTLEDIGNGIHKFICGRDKCNRDEQIGKDFSMLVVDIETRCIQGRKPLFSERTIRNYDVAVKKIFC